MGRSGGGSGRSGGGFGGRSSGGFSGGGRSSGGSFSRGFGFSTGPRFHFGPSYYGGYGSGCGCGGGLTTLIIIFIIYIFISFYEGCATNGCISSNNTGVDRSTKVREKLDGVVTKSDWYEDQVGWVSSEKVLIEGLEDFYKETGAQPYVLLIKYSDDFWNGSNLNIEEADKYLNDIYDKKFEDEGHFIFAYFQCANDSKQEMEGEFRYLSGDSVDTIMDNEAIDIFWGYFKANYYNTSLTLEEMISNTFTKTANNIMQNPNEGSNLPMVLSIILISILLIVVIVALVNKNKKNKSETAEKVEKPVDIIVEDNKDEENK